MVFKLKRQKRKNTKFSKKDYNLILDAYQELKGMTLKGKEFDPIMQDIKTMFLSERKPEEIMSCMEWMAEDKFYKDKWTISTVKKKIPEFLAKEDGDIEIPSYAKGYIKKP